MAGMSCPNLETLGAVRLRGFWLGAIHHGFGSVPDGFLTLLHRGLTPSSYASLTKLAG